MDFTQLLQNMTNGVAKGSCYALVAVGYTMVYGVLQLINFAHSDVYMLGAYFAYWPAKWMGYLPDEKGGRAQDVPLALVGLFVVGSMVACAAVGALIERAAYRPLRNSGRLAPLITAIGVSLLLEYGGQMVFGTEPRLFPTFVEAQSYDVGGVKFANTSIIIVVTAAVLMGALTLFVNHTRQGRALRAVSHSFNNARLMGINVNATITMTFMLGSSLAAVGGILVAMDQPTITPLMGLRMGLKAFVAAVLGGIGSIPGAALGGLLLGVSESVVAYWSTTYSEAVAFLILIGVLLVRPAGILGSAAREKV
ncbi:MAG: High-affinity branched-chain amino acid transport system permease protein LivH [Planctomycetes bacterium]|nr:High-affinity branched-chain amino acid transport system permease protein LivH [Planctomycetota bacterium]GIK53676.1 MAG: branched-chain amino acid ABC transporter permease [Planctomycetota bacterium]HRJ78272.1 branched-chain amino acid ABC transporter permease [Planctomycetota bacterium]